MTTPIWNQRAAADRAEVLRDLWWADPQGVSAHYAARMALYFAASEGLCEDCHGCGHDVDSLGGTFACPGCNATGLDPRGAI